MRGGTSAAQMIWIGLCACAMRADAQAAQVLRVERGPGAESCPDTAELGERVAAIRGESAGQAHRYNVSFAYDGRTFSAQLRSDADSSSLRSLESTAPSCAALAKATAVTLALLFDAEPAAENQPETAPPEPVATPSPAVAPVAAPPPTAAAPAERIQLGAALGGGLAAGVISPWAPALLAELGLRVSALRFALGVVWLPEQQVSLAPGTSELELLAADARVCYGVFRRPWLQVEACSGVLLGSTSAAASGYTNTPPTSHLLYAALPIELALGQTFGGVGWELGATLLIPYRRNQFEIEGLGTVYETPPLSGLLSLRATGWLPL